MGIALEFDAGPGCARACLSVDVVRCSITVPLSVRLLVVQWMLSLISGGCLSDALIGNAEVCWWTSRTRSSEHDIATGLKSSVALLTTKSVGDFVAC